MKKNREKLKNYWIELDCNSGEYTSYVSIESPSKVKQEDEKTIKVGRTTIKFDDDILSVAEDK